MATTINASTSAGLVSTADTSGVLQLQTAGTTAVTLSAAQAATFAGVAQFPTTIGVGGATPSTSGSGITFPATQSASTDVNTLDDYEEGTWTPSVGGTATYTTQQGTYVKIGKAVYFTGYVNVSAIGTGSTTSFTGLPFATAATSNWVNTVATNSSATGIVSVYCTVSSTTINFLSRTASSTDPAANAIIKNGAAVEVNGFYFTS